MCLVCSGIRFPSAFFPPLRRNANSHPSKKITASVKEQNPTFYFRLPFFLPFLPHNSPSCRPACTETKKIKRKRGPKKRQAIPTRISPFLTSPGHLKSFFPLRGPFPFATPGREQEVSCFCPGAATERKKILPPRRKDENTLTSTRTKSIPQTSQRPPNL